VNGATQIVTGTNEVMVVAAAIVAMMIAVVNVDTTIAARSNEMVLVHLTVLTIVVVVKTAMTIAEVIVDTMAAAGSNTMVRVQSIVVGGATMVVEAGIARKTTAVVSRTLDPIAAAAIKCPVEIVDTPLQVSLPLVVGGQLLTTTVVGLHLATIA
jgi:hypothetical protein